MSNQRPHLILPLLAAGTALALYALTLAPTVGAGDAAELALAAQRGAIPHPPGYPLWGMAAWLFVRLPFLAQAGDAAWRANLFSAACAAAAVGFLVALARRLGLSRPAALLAAGLVMVCPFVWAEATHAEVHALNLLLLVLAGLSGEALARRATPRHAALLGGAGALLLGHHQANIFLLPLLGAAAWPALRRPRLLAALAGGGLLGLLPLLWVPLRALGHPELDWFGAGRPEHLLAAWGRGFYGPLRQNAFELPLLSAQISATLAQLLLGCGLPALALAVPGTRAFAARRPALTRLALATAGLVLAGPWLLLNPRPDAAHLLSLVPTWYPVVLLVALTAGRGLDRGVALARRRLARTRPLDAASLPTLRTLRLSAAGLAALLVAFRLTGGYATADRHADRVARWYGEDLLATVAPHGTLFVEGDNEMFLAAYLQQVDGLRPDVTVIQRRGYLLADPFGWRGRPRAEVTAERAAAEERFVRAAEGPVYFDALPDWVGGASLAVRREGLLWRVTTTERAAAEHTPAPAPWNDYHAAVWQVAPARLDFLTRKCLVAYYQARAESCAAGGHPTEAREAWAGAARVGYDFVETPALLATLDAAGPEAVR